MCRLTVTFSHSFFVAYVVTGLLSLAGCSGSGALSPKNPAGDFEIGVSPSTLAAEAGSSGSLTISTTGTNGFSGSIKITITGLPAGVSTSPSFPLTIAVGKAQTVQLSVSASTGNFPLTVTGTSGSLSHSASLNLTIKPAPDFSVGISATTITAAPGSSSFFTVAVAGQNGFNSSVGIAITGLPSGAATSPASPFNLSAGGSQNVSFSIPSTASPGNYSVVISGTSASLTHSATLALTVSTVPDFSISVSPLAITATAGTSNSTFSVSITGVNGFSGSVSVSFGGLPAGASTSPPSPFGVAAGSSQSVSLSIPSTAPPGNYTVAVNGTSGTLAHSATLALTINPPPDFSIAVSPTAMTVSAGTSTSAFTVSITGQNGFTNSVTVTLGGLPNGTTSSPVSPFSVAAGNSQSVTLNVPTTTRSGAYSVTAMGTSGTLTHSALLALTIVGTASITTWHYDNSRSGANVNETILAPSNVNSSSFGKIATFPVDGFVVGHPLYLENVNIPGQGIHNVVYAATMHDSVYAFAADSTNTSPLWATSILNYSPPGATTVPATVKKDPGTTGWSELGIISTPVIDPSTGTLYLVAETYENGKVVHRLHALDVTSGVEVSGGPTTIAATYTFNGVTTTFADLYQMNRPGLLLANGHVYIAWGSNGNNNYSQGWVLSYNASTLQQEAAYTTEPGQTLASIWQKGAGISADSDGNIYVETGEGPYAAGTNLSTSVLKLSQNGSTLALADWFTPYNYQYLSQNDMDLANAVVILPDQAGQHPHEAVAIGKQGTIYLLDRDNMGKLCTTCTGDTQIVEEIPPPSGSGYMTAVYWNNLVYFTGAATTVAAYALSNGLLVVPPSAQSAKLVGTTHAMITANGNSNGILWLIESGAYLEAMDAISLNTLYSSNQAPAGRDTLPPLAHFASPIAADGKVFIGTQNSVVVYGLLSTSSTSQDKNQRSMAFPNQSH